jgi:DNA-binding NarL/FixJ family response regulator
MLPSPAAGVVAASPHIWLGAACHGISGGSRNAETGTMGQADAMTVRCLIVDDSQAFLAAARDLLEREGLHVVAVASTGDEAHRQCLERRPDVALVDIDLGGESGFDVARQLTAAGPDCRVILISAYSGGDFADMVEESSAVSFLPKPQLSAAAIHGILAGEGRCA